jgi:hypothetical protein
MSKLKFFVVFWIFTAACNFSNSPTDVPADTKIPDDLIITLERTGCYATVNVCPIYHLTIKADGSVVFEGKDATRVKGKIEDKISGEKVNRLIGEFQKADFFKLENSYDHENCPSFATDSPEAKTFIQIGGKQKSVRHNLGCRGKNSENFPAQLYELENKIDEIVETKRWIGERK